MRTVSACQVATLAVIIAAALMWTSSASVAPAPAPGREESCGKVVGSIMSCLPFVKGDAKEPSKRCCEGTKKLDEESKTTELRKKACECIKAAMGSIKGIKTNLVAEVPEKCGIKTKLPPIDADFDCSKIESNIFRGYY